MTSLAAALAREQQLRQAAEDNTRAVLDAMRALAASQDAEIAGRVEEERAALEREMLSRAGAPVLVSTDAADAAAAAARRSLVLYQLAARAGVRSARIESAVRLYGDAIDFLDDGTPIVGATADTNVVGYLATTVRTALPEWMEYGR
jgi:hypothetical protein